jgi:import inner membrane translocase subunit TIM44
MTMAVSFSAKKHKDSAWKDSWKDFKDSNPMMQKLFAIKENYNESENPLISTARSISAD